MNRLELQQLNVFLQVWLGPGSADTYVHVHSNLPAPMSSVHADPACSPNVRLWIKWYCKRRGSNFREKPIRNIQS